MATLQSALEEIMRIVAGVPGIQKAPALPPESLGVFPYAVGYPGSGELDNAPPDVMTGLHDVVLEVHVARKDLPADAARVLPYADAVPAALYLALRDGHFRSLQTFRTITYQFGGMAYNGIQTLGYRFTLQGVKIQSNIEEQQA